MTLHRKAKIQSDPYQGDDERTDELIDEVARWVEASIESAEYRLQRMCCIPASDSTMVIR